MPRAARRGPHGRAAPSAAVGRRSLVPAWDGAQPHRVDAQQADIRHLADGKARPDPTAPTQNPKTLHPKPYTPRRHARACPRVPARTENAPSRNASAGTSERTRPHIVRSVRVGAEQREQDRDHRRVLRARRMRLHRTHVQHMQRAPCDIHECNVRRAKCSVQHARCTAHHTRLRSSSGESEEHVEEHVDEHMPTTAAAGVRECVGPTRGSART